MHVLAIIHFPIFGGPHNQVAALDEALRRRGVTTTVVLPDEPGNAVGRLAAAGIPVHSIKLGRIRASLRPRTQLQTAAHFRADVRKLRAVIRREGADLVLIPGLANPHGALAARLEDVPVVWQVVDTRVPAAPRFVLMGVVRGLADAVMFWGHRLQAVHAGRLALRMPVVVAASPVDAARFAPSSGKRAKVREELRLPADVPVVGLVGNLNPQKGLEHFLDAAELVLRGHPAAHFVVVGAMTPTHRAYAEQLESRIRDSARLRDRVLLVGGREDVDAVLAAVDILAVTAVPASEGIPTVALEAMATGVPVVSTDVGAVAEAVHDGVHGLIVPPLDAGRIAAALGALLDNPQRRRAMGEASRRHVQEQFAPDRIADLHVEAFDAAFAHHGARRGADRAHRRGSPALVALQAVIPDYRVAFWEAIPPLIDGAFEVWAGRETFEPTIQPATVQPACARTVANRFIAGRRLLVQALPWRRLIGARVVVAELNPRILTTWALLLARRVLGRPTVLWGHAWPRGGRHLRSERVRHLQRRLATGILTYTEEQRSALAERMPGTPVHAAPNAMYSAADMAPALPPDGDPTGFLYVGRLVAAKRPALLVEAFAIAAPRLPEHCDLVILGDGPERKSLERLAAELGVANRVRFGGHVAGEAALRPHYARAVASVSPGYVGLSVTQSLGFGVPMIYADDEPHSPEIEAVVDGCNAVAFRAGSADALAGVLVAVHNDRAAWRERRARIAADCAERYSLETMARRFVEAATGGAGEV